MSTVATTEPPIIAAPVIAPVVAPAPGATDAPPAAPEPKLFAGRFKGVQEGEKGYRELATSLGIPVPKEGEPLFGPGRLFTDASALENGYGSLLTFQGKLGDAAKAAAPKVPAAAEIKPGEPIVISPVPAAPVVTPPAEDDLPIDAKLAKVGLTKAELYKQWKKPASEGGGKLTADQYAKLKTGLGWTPKVADEMTGTQARAHDSDIADVHRIAAHAAGGEQQLAALIGWANKHYEGNAAAAADLTTRLHNTALTATVINELRFAYSVAAGAEGSRPTVNAGAGAAPSAAGPYTAYDEWSKVHDKYKAGTATAEEIARYNATKNPSKLR